MLTTAVWLLEGPIPGSQPALVPAVCGPTGPWRLLLLFIFIALLVLRLPVLCKMLLLSSFPLFLFPWGSTLEASGPLFALRVAPEEGLEEVFGGQPPRSAQGPANAGLSQQVHLHLGLGVLHHFDGHLQGDRRQAGRPQSRTLRMGCGGSQSPILAFSQLSSVPDRGLSGHVGHMGDSGSPGPYLKVTSLGRG